MLSEAASVSCHFRPPLSPPGGGHCHLRRRRPRFLNHYRNAILSAE